MSEEAQGAEVPAAAPAAGGDAASVHGSQVGSAVGSRAASIAGDVAPVGQIGGEPGPGSVANESVHGAATHAPRVPVKLEDVVAKNRRWAEACDKETKMIRLSTTFMVGNRNNLDIFPEKPNRLNLPVVNADVARESGEVRAAADDGPRGGLPLQTPGGAQPDVSERQSRVRDHRVRGELRRDHRRGAVRA